MIQLKGKKMKMKPIVCVMLFICCVSARPIGKIVRTILTKGTAAIATGAAFAGVDAGIDKMKESPQIQPPQQGLMPPQVTPFTPSLALRPVVENGNNAIAVTILISTGSCAGIILFILILFLICKKLFKNKSMINSLELQDQRIN